MALNTEQTSFMLKPVDPERVEKVNEKDNMRHLRSWDIRRHLIRVFGFGGFDIETKRVQLIREVETTPGKWTVIYLAEVRLTIKNSEGNTIAVFEDGSCGDAPNYPQLGKAHDKAIKTALSGALKRCAVNLGDQFGLSLYDKKYNEHNPAAVVGRTLATTDTPVTNNTTLLAETIHQALDPATTYDNLKLLRNKAELAGLLNTKWTDTTGEQTTLGDVIHKRGALLKLRDQGVAYTATDIDDDDLDGVLA